MKANDVTPPKNQRLTFFFFFFRCSLFVQVQDSLDKGINAYSKALTNSEINKYVAA